MVQNIEIKMNSGRFWGVSIDFLVLTVGRYKLKTQNSKSIEKPRNTQNAYANKVIHLYFYILDHFQAIYGIELNFHTNRTPSLGHLWVHEVHAKSYDLSQSLQIPCISLYFEPPPPLHPPPSPSPSPIKRGASDSGERDVVKRCDLT